MESIIFKISHFLLLLLVCAMVFILIQDPYIISEQKISVDIKQSSAKNITVWQSSDVLECRYNAKHWSHYLNDKDKASAVDIKCADKSVKADKISRQAKQIQASGNVLYTDKSTQLKSEQVSYNLDTKVLQNNVPTVILGEQSTIKAPNGVRYDMANGVLDIENFYMKIKGNK